MSDKKIVLNVNGIEVIYNHVILVLKGVSLQVPEQGIVAILGGNGAGKTTTLRAISNLLKGERGDVTKGSIELRGERIENLTPADLVNRGVVQVMEGRHCFAHLTIEENLMTGSYTRKDKGEIAANLEKVYTYFPRLKTRRTSQAAYTSGGEQQMWPRLDDQPERHAFGRTFYGLGPTNRGRGVQHCQRFERERKSHVLDRRAEHQHGAQVL